MNNYSIIFFVLIFFSNCNSEKRFDSNLHSLGMEEYFEDNIVESLDKAVVHFDNYLSFRYPSVPKQDRVYYFLSTYNNYIESNSDSIENINKSFEYFQKDYNRLFFLKFFDSKNESFNNPKSFNTQYNILKNEKIFFKSEKVRFFQFEANNVNSYFYCSLYNIISEKDSLTKAWIESKIITSSLGQGATNYLLENQSRQNLNSTPFKILIITDIIFPYFNKPSSQSIIKNK